MAERRDASGQPVVCGCCGLPMAEVSGDGRPICACTDACADADTCLVPGGTPPPAVLAELERLRRG